MMTRLQVVCLVMSSMMPCCSLAMQKGHTQVLHTVGMRPIGGRLTERRVYLRPELYFKQTQSVDSNNSHNVVLYYNNASVMTCHGKEYDDLPSKVFALYEQEINDERGTVKYLYALDNNTSAFEVLIKKDRNTNNSQVSYAEQGASGLINSQQYPPFKWDFTGSKTLNLSVRKDTEDLNHPHIYHCVYSGDSQKTHYLDSMNNIHILDTEELRMPILGLLGSWFTIGIQYVDRQVTSYSRHTGLHVRLQPSPTRQAQWIQMTNTAFIMWLCAAIAYKVYAFTH